ncbi:MAG: hypothetical protein JNM76_02500 [Betaproteobacteria bacterium]|nr:hypothetical protein [Betaproteobacteria bacterium]
MRIAKLLGIGLLTLGVTASSAAAPDVDALRALLEESRAQQKGLTFHVNGSQLAGLVVSVGDKYVTAKSQALGTIVIRLDRIDAVTGHVQERK